MTKTKKVARMAVAVAMSGALMIGGAALINNSKAYAATSDALYVSDYSSKTEAIKAGLELNEKIAEEGMILVKNNGALPIPTGIGTAGAKVTVLGYAGVDTNAGSSKNGGGDNSAGAAIALADVYSSLQDSGYKLNPVVKSQYEAWLQETTDGVDGRGNPTKVQTYTSDASIASALKTESAKDSWKKSIAQYDDAAIVVLGAGSNRLGTAEGQRTHTLQLDKEQYDLIDYATENFEKVIVLINSVQPLEIGDIQKNDEVDAILIIGEAGDNGFNAVGKILSGEVNPSGRTSDTWASDFTKDPSYYSFNTQAANDCWSIDGNGDITGYYQYKVNGQAVKTWAAGYEEGIYVGYRYYETRSYEENQKSGATTDAWYNENVVYTFGQGLSYTDFEWTVTPVTEADSTVTASNTLKFDVTVENVGKVAGKDVVQLYYTAPYTNGGLEKSYVALGDYAKTKELTPGESQTVRVSIDVSDMASYDYKTTKSYLLEAGTYNIKIAHSAHDYEADFDYEVASNAKCGTSVTGAEITNQFDDVTAGFEANFKSLSRKDGFANFEQLTKLTDDTKYLTISENEYKKFNFEIGEYDENYSDIGTVKYATDTSGRTTETYKTVLSDLIGAPADDPRYQDMVEQLTLEELCDFIKNGGYHSINIDYLGVPLALNTDGPKGWTGTFADTTYDRDNYILSEPMVAWTFNKELAYELGRIIGEQGLWGNSTQESGVAYTYTGWYAPGMNIHRSPFDSRYTEYFSEDPVLTGYTAANTSLGANSKGCYITLKHFAFHNDGGGTTSYRGGQARGSNDADAAQGLSAWMNEQAIREIYLKGFQIAVEEGNAKYVMASFTRIGAIWAGGSYALMTNVLRNEWGFEGAVVTDLAMYAMCDAYQLVEAGGGTMLDATSKWGYFGQNIDVETINSLDATSKNVLIHCMQQTVKQHMYLVANSNAMQTPWGARVVYTGTYENEDEEVVDITLADATVGTAYTSVAVNTAELNTTYAYSKISYTVSGLPAGLSYDAASGTIKGTPTESGKFTVVVTASADNYKSASVEYTLNVNSDKNYITSDDVQQIVDSSNDNYITSDDAQQMIDDAMANQPKSSGCGSAISVLPATAAALVGVAAVAVAGVAIRRHKNKEN